ncbi:hypothetical protein [Paenibacillus sp. FSL K6-1318]|uniref:hypothetical protein n=1 Tax=Paenibacillus sp. FSL K6-1318 TaxID=2975291 RepID=UPI0030ED428C
MKFKSLVSGFLVAALLSIGPNVFADASKPQAFEGIAYNKADLNEFASLENIKFSQDEGYLEVSFELNGKNIEIEAVNFGKDENGNKYATKEREDGISFNLLESNGNITGVAVNTKVSPINQTIEDAFGFVISKSADQTALKQTLNQVKSEHSITLKKSLQNINSLPHQELSLSDVRPMAADLHVLASGLSVPFLISGGFSEGWVYSSYQTQQFFKLTNLRYSIAYNWPSDGVSLWYDYLNSNQAYHSPAWPSAGQQNVGGEWIIDATKGKFAAETTVSAIVKLVPLMWTIYDTANIR